MSMESQWLEHGGRRRPGEVVGGYLSALAIFIGAIAIAWHPLRLAPPAMLLAIVGAAMQPRASRLGLAGVAIAGLGFFLGMTIAVVVSHPLW
ncbi:MAG TPA: hypothetical protein VHD91_06360 [Gaiellaceae bacterium]|nr:hypothetical protein [Gaiellaceae bacterium]